MIGSCYRRIMCVDRMLLLILPMHSLRQDLFERMCKEMNWKCCKLDGKCSIKKRTQV